MSALWWRITLCVLLCLFAPIPGKNWLQGSEDHFSWISQIVKPVRNISIDKIMGTWYMVEEVAPTAMSPWRACIWYEFQRQPSGNVTVGWYEDDGSHRWPVVEPMSYHEPGLWVLPVVYMGFAVLDVTPDGRYLSVAICVRYAMSCTAAVFARDMADGGRGHLSQLREVHRRLAATGLNNTSTGHLKLTHICAKGSAPTVTPEDLRPVEYDL